MPVSLGRGHIRTGDFNINLKELYYINIDLDYQYPEDAKCEVAGPDSILKTHLILYRDGRVLGERRRR